MAEARIIQFSLKVAQCKVSLTMNEVPLSGRVKLWWTWFYIVMALLGGT